MICPTTSVAPFSVDTHFVKEIQGQTLSENQSITEIDANDKTSNGDKDIDQEKITYNCFFPNCQYLGELIVFLI